MHIGVDARSMSGSLSGIGRYTLELSKALNSYSALELSLYTPASIDAKTRIELQAYRHRSSSAPNRFLKMVWSQSILPYWASKDRIDLFWGATHRLPRFLPQSIARVVTIHDLVYRYAPQTMRPLSLFIEKQLLPEAIKLADLVMVDSQGTSVGIHENFPQYAHKVRVVHLGASAPELSTDSSGLTSLGIHQSYCLFVGTLEPRKNLERLIQAYASLPESRRQKTILVIAGGKGWGGVNLEVEIKKNNLQQSVKLVGYVNDQQLSALYANARFLVMPSIYEGFGLPVVEAMQYGTPVLVSHTGCLAEITGDAGVLVDPLSVKSIAHGLEQLIRDDDLVAILGVNSLRRGQYFNWNRCATETLKVFNEAMALRDKRIANAL
jgi:glycosyltransferase involved in cell wall biosynthesis